MADHGGIEDFHGVPLRWGKFPLVWRAAARKALLAGLTGKAGHMYDATGDEVIQALDRAMKIFHLFVADLFFEIWRFDDSGMCVARVGFCHGISSPPGFLLSNDRKIERLTHEVEALLILEHVDVVR